MSPFDLHGRTVLVTGAGQGIGRAIAMSCAAHGATVIVNDLVAERAGAVEAEIAQQGGDARALAFDVTDWAAVNAALVGDDPVDCDVVVNNAGIPPGEHAQRPFVEETPDDWAPWVQLSLFGTMHVTRSVLPGMIARGHGRVINIVSEAGRVGFPGVAGYSAAKAAVAGFTRGLACEVGRRGVTANCIALGGIKTETMLAVFELDESAERAAAKQYAMRRLGNPEDAAGAVLFLASDAASWVTGQTYVVNGGFSYSL